MIRYPRTISDTGFFLLTDHMFAFLHVGKPNRPHLLPWQVTKAKAMAARRKGRKVSRTGRVARPVNPIIGWATLVTLFVIIGLCAGWWVPVIIFGILGTLGWFGDRAGVEKEQRAAEVKRIKAESRTASKKGK